jgi:hypothetical protein
VRTKAKLPYTWGYGSYTSRKDDYTSEEYAVVACMILEGDGACSREAVEMRLGSIAAPAADNSAGRQKAGQTVLKALCAANAIALDHWSPSTTWAGGALAMSSTSELGQIVTAPNAFDLYCWQQKEVELRQVIRDAEAVSGEG